VNESASAILSAVADPDTVTAAVVHPGSLLEQVLLSGEDADRFAKIKLLVGARSVTAIVIGDHDGPTAVAWIDEFGDRKGLAQNEIVSALVDRHVAGPAVVTGLGEGNHASMTSLHSGLQAVLVRMSSSSRLE
jgi:hypothetical protein